MLGNQSSSAFASDPLPEGDLEHLETLVLGIKFWEALAHVFASDSTSLEAFFKSKTRDSGEDC